MTTQLKLVAVGYIDTDRPANDTLVCDPSWTDTWFSGAQNSMDALPVDHPRLFMQEDDYRMGEIDRMLGMGSRSYDYDDDDRRMAYVAGYCATRLLSDAEIAAELEEYQDDIADRDYWAKGQW